MKHSQIWIKGECVNGEPREIDYYEFLKESAPTEDLLEYKDLLGRLYHQNSEDIRYLVSASVCRMEAQTHLFDSMYKYIKILKLREESASLVITSVPPLFCTALQVFLRKEKIPFKLDHPYALFFYKLKMTKIFFWLKILALSFYTLLFSRIAKKKLGKWKVHGKYLFLSYYDYRSIRKDGSYLDSYFAPFQEDLVKKDIPFSVVSIILGKKNLRNIIKHLKDFKGMQKETHIAPLESLLEIKDVLCILKNSIQHYFRFYTPLYYKHRDVSVLLDLSLREDFCLRNNWFFAYTIYQIAPKVLGSGFERIYYPYENHPWERLLNKVRVEKKSETRTYAYQHTSFSLKLLNHFPSQFDSKLNLPNKIVTVGKVLSKFLEEYGSFDEGQVEDGCALRHLYLHSSLPVQEGSKSQGIAFAFSSDEKTYPLIVKSLIEFFKESSYSVYLKPHPLFKGTNVIEEDLPKNIINAEDIPWAEIYKKIDMLFYHDNSLGIEVFAHGIFSCEYSITGDVYDCFRLYGYEGQYLKIRNSDDFKKVMKQREDWFKDTQSSAQEGVRMKSYLEDYFVKATSEAMEVFTR